MPSSGLTLELLRSSMVVVSMELLIYLFVNIVEKYYKKKKWNVPLQILG